MEELRCLRFYNSYANWGMYLCEVKIRDELDEKFRGSDLGWKYGISQDIEMQSFCT